MAGPAILFLHLLGLDSQSHAHGGPAAAQYAENIGVVDRGVAALVAHMEARYPDGKTAYVVTSDHGNGACYTLHYVSRLPCGGRCHECGHWLVQDDRPCQPWRRVPRVHRDTPRYLGPWHRSTSRCAVSLQARSICWRDRQWYIGLAAGHRAKTV